MATLVIMLPAGGAPEKRFALVDTEFSPRVMLLVFDCNSLWDAGDAMRRIEELKRKPMQSLNFVASRWRVPAFIICAVCPWLLFSGQFAADTYRQPEMPLTEVQECLTGGSDDDEDSDTLSGPALPELKPPRRAVGHALCSLPGLGCRRRAVWKVAMGIARRGCS